LVLHLHHAEDAVITELRLASKHTADFEGMADHNARADMEQSCWCQR
jgi:hypothetical protein